MLVLPDVDHDDVALAERSDRAALRRLRGDVPDHEAVGRPGEAAVGDERDRLRQPLADDRPGDVEHLAHARAPVRPSYRITTTSSAAIRPAFTAKHSSSESNTRAGPRWRVRSWPASHRAALGREVAVEHRDAAAGLERLLDRDDDGLAVLLDRLAGDLAEGAAVDGLRIAVEQAGLHQLARDERDPAGRVHVVRVPAPPGLHVRDDRRRRRDPLEVVDREVDPEVARDRDQVEHPFVEPPVAATDATAFSKDSFVTKERGVTLSRTTCTASRPISYAASPSCDASPGSRSCRRARARGSRGSSTSCWR